MTSLPNTPLTEIAATPRNQYDSKFAFVPNLPNNHKYVELPSVEPFTKPQAKPSK